MKVTLIPALLACLLASQASASETRAKPLFELTSGLPGEQVRLSWPSVAGTRYSIQKSTTLIGAWSQIAMVEANDESTAWVDPIATTTQAFYRVSLPQIELTKISIPLLTSVGGTLQLRGQCIPLGSVLVLEIDGQDPVLLPLSSLGSGVWEAAISGNFAPGARIIAARIEDNNGLLLLDVNLPVTVTETGRASDSPPALPPGAPMSSGKKGYQSYLAKSDMGSAAAIANPLFQFNDTDGEMPATSAFASKKGYDHYQSSSAMDASAGFSKKGYDFYKAKSDSRTSGLNTNPYYAENGSEGVMPAVAPSGLPGEVSFRVTSISLPCPAGPPLAWTSTYRSMKPVSSGLGAGWDFSYNISIEPLPASDGASASRLVVRDGGGRADVYHRQPDGSFRCDGMFREGSFDGEVFTLTFADQGTWTFSPLDGSPDAGKIASIIDRNGVAIACAYDLSGQLASVSDAFGRGLSVTWDTASPPRIASVSSTGDRGVIFAAVDFTYSPNERQLIAASAPFVAGSLSPVGDMTFAYSSGSPDPRLNDNLLSITDGAGRLLEAFSYSSSTSPGDIVYDTCRSHDRNRLQNIGQVCRTSFAILLDGYTMTENDELGRVCETTFDGLHRVLSRRQYTGFATPGEEVTASSNRPTGKLRASDPDFFETSYRYNPDSRCVARTHPDGSRERVTYERDLKPDGPVRERGNARVMTIQVANGDSRTVSCQYLPGYGAPEAARTGHAIGGSPTRGNGLSSGAIAGIIVGANSPVLDPDDDGDTIPTTRSSRGWDGTYKGKPILAMLSRGIDNDCDGIDDDCDGFVTRLTSSLGQSSTRTYDGQGNCTVALSPLPGRGTLSQYDGLGRCLSVTTLNGPDSSFRDELTYDGDTGFLSMVTCDSTGLQLTTRCFRDPQGRVTRVVDPRGHDWLYDSNPLHQCVSQSSPAVPVRITTTITYDAGSRSARSDHEHQTDAGSAVTANPLYTTFYVRDLRGRLIRVAKEERPVDSTGLLVPDPTTLSNYAVCDITYDATGQCVTLSTPAASRAQTSDLACDFSYDERGLLFRCIEGGQANPSPVTTQYDYDSFGTLVRSTILGLNISSETLYAYDEFHRPISITDPMGNITTYNYSNNGLVTCSVYGEVNDVPGSAGNVLLSRSSSLSFPLSGGLPGSASLTLPGVSDACYDLNLSSSSRRRGAGLMSNKQGDPNANRYDFGSSAFFNLEVEDDTFLTERFSPGESGPHATETTIVDRSPAGLVGKVTRNGDVLLTCAYDSAGRLTSSSNGASTITTTRDANGNILVCGKTDHLLAGSGGPPDKTFSVTRVFDPLNRGIQSTDGSGNVTAYAYDSLGRCLTLTEPGGLVVTTEFDGTGPTGPYSSRVSGDFNGDGSPVILRSRFARCGELVSTTDSYGNRTAYTRDSLGRVTRCDHPDTTFETWRYNFLGKNDEWVCQNTCVRAIAYDQNARPIQVSWTNPQSVAPSSPTAHLWDGLGRCVRSAQGASTVVCLYDSLGNPVGDTSDGHTIVRSFDHRGRTGITYPDGSAYAESRSPLGLLLSVATLDEVGAPLSPAVVTMAYAGERVWRSTQGNGVVTTSLYRGDGEEPQPGGNDSSFDRCVRVTITDPSSNVLSETLLRRDANHRARTCEAMFTASPQGPGRAQVFTRDALGRVTACLTSRRESRGAVAVTESDVVYTLDLEGRRLTATGGDNPGSYTQSATLPPGDQQMGQYTTSPGGNLRWDDRGNLASFNTAAGQVDYGHDAEGRLIAFNDPATGTAALGFEYDALGRRTVRDDQTGKTTRFIYDGEVCIQELGADGKPDVNFVCVDGVQRCISTRNGTSLYPHGGGSVSAVSLQRGPHHESPNVLAATLVTDAAGAATERFAFDDAGAPIFLEADGSPGARNSAIGPIRWMAPQSIWEPSYDLFLGGDTIESPSLGMTVSRHNGHVTVLKAHGGGGSGGRIVVVFRISVGGGGSPGATRATDHNSSRSNKTST